MSRQVIVVRSKTEEDAVVRMQSDAIMRGLRGNPETVASTFVVGSSVPPPTLSPEACILFHYDDIAAVAVVRSMLRAGTVAAVGCLGSDVYSFDDYLAVHDIVDFYTAPTRLHRLVLMSQLCRPVYLLPESIDSPATGGDVTLFPTRKSKRLLWFGYPESFEKSMVSLVPVIKLHEQRGTIESFTLISDREKFQNRFDLAITPYDKATFAREAASFDYCILSHLSLDLALNSFIKSPNKLVTALFLGLIPLVSRTPSYEDLLTEFGLERFLYESPADLNSKLKGLDPGEDSAVIRRSGILEALKDRLSDAHIAREFLDITSEVARRDKEYELDLKPESLEPKTPEVQIRDHLYDFIPSIRRAFQWRMSKR